MTNDAIWTEHANGEATKTETIICPECETVQPATVAWNEYDPWPAYVHTCTACGYIIMESEWNTTEDNE